MRAKKAVKRLARISALLSEVISEYAPAEKKIRESLSTAKASVKAARKTIDQQASAEAAEKKAASPKKAQSSHVGVAGKGRSSLAPIQTEDSAKPKRGRRAASAIAESRTKADSHTKAESGTKKAKGRGKRKGLKMPGRRASLGSRDSELTATAATSLPGAHAVHAEVTDQAESQAGAPHV